MAVLLNTAMDRSRWLTLLWSLASLLYLTRPDAVLIVAAAAAPRVLARSRAPGSFCADRRSAAAGVAWTIFALVYYGFPFPNTAYAKLATGIDPGELRAQGLLYLLDSLDRDPITLTTIAFASVVAAFAAHALAPRCSRGIVCISGTSCRSAAIS